MATREITIRDEVGLHARPAARFVKLAKSFTSQITVRRDERSANAKSLVDVLTLEAGQGVTVTIEAQGEDAAQAVDELAALLNGDGS